MKRFLSIAALASGCFLFSCENGGPNSVNNKNMEANKDVYKGIETGDTTKFAIIADDAVDHEPGPDGKEVKSGQAIKTMLADFHNHIKDLKMDVETEAANGDYVFSLIHMTGTAQDGSMGFPAGQKIDSRSVDLIKFKDGKASEHWGFMDMNEAMKMMHGGQMQ